MRSLKCIKSLLTTYLYKWICHVCGLWSYFIGKRIMQENILARTPFCLVWNIVIINDNAKLPNIKKRNLPSILRCPYPFHKIRLHNLSLEVAPCMCHLIKLVPVYGMLHSHCEEHYLDKQIKNMLKTNLYD